MLYNYKTKNLAELSIDCSKQICKLYTNNSILSEKQETCT